MAACSSDDTGGTTNGAAATTTTSPSTMGTMGSTADTSTVSTSMGGTTTASTSIGGSGGMAAGGATSTSMGGVGGVGGASSTGGGTGGTGPVAPETLSETGLFTMRGGEMGELVPTEGVREFEPRYWLWSDGSFKRRYVYLPPDSQIDTSDPDHWVLPAGTKLWKSFVVGEEGKLVETRLIERTGDGDDDWLFATYYWETVDATDATLVPFGDQMQNAQQTTHDIPNGIMCGNCHSPLKDRALGFSALQLNHDGGGLNLATLMDEGWLTDPISLDIQPPGDDPLTQDALGYLHANCGNCHNDSPGIPVDSVPEPRMYLRLSVNDLTVDDTGAYQTAVNQPTTAMSSTMLGFDTRIVGGDETTSTVFYRMNQRLVEDQMPPIGTELTDPDGLALIQSWIQSLPPPQ
jgi:hypothetical protein